MKEFYADALSVKIFDSRAEAGKCAAEDVKAQMRRLLDEKEEINMIFAAAPSQNEVLQALAADDSLDWNRVNAFHMDEYIGLDKDAPQGFGNFLKERLFSRVPFKSVHYLDIAAADAEEETRRYADLLQKYPADIVVLGIGENGHVAFNDPPVADFHDEKLVKVVTLDETCRRQQVNDGCFAKTEDVPTQAMTLTVPALLAALYLFCVVPAATKAKAVRETVRGAIGEHCPASILRTKENAVLYLDGDSASLL